MISDQFITLTASDSLRHPLLAVATAIHIHFI